MTKKETPANLKARSAMRGFCSALEDKLKRFQPIDYAPFASLVMRRGLDDLRTGICFPPFKILHSIEANCAYARGQNRDPVDKYGLGAVMNVWHKNPNLLFEDAVEENVQHFVLLMHREQMELQYRHSRDETARIQRLFITGNPMPGVSAKFQNRYGLTIERWIQLSWLTYAACNQQQSGCFRKSAIRGYEGIEISEQELDAYFALASRTRKQIGERFREEVLAMHPELRFLIRSVFLETPIIDFGEDRALAPLPDLVLRNTGHGTYGLVKPLPNFDKEFGDSVQAYVEEVLKCLHGAQLFLDDTQVGRLSAGTKACDFLVELDDCVLLVECKATTFVATGLLEHVILSDGSTGKVADGIVQLYSTAHELERGTFKAHGVSSDKPVLGIVATFGEIPIANNEWYFESFVLERAAKELRPPIYPSSRMERRPVVMSLQTLEDLVMLINTTGVSAADLYDEKLQLPYIQVGDWKQYLGKKLRHLGEEVKPLPFVQSEIDHLHSSMIGERLLRSSGD